MKLNLLPTHVSKGSQTRTAILLSVVIVAASFFAAAFMISKSNAALQTEIDRVNAALPIAQQGVAISTEADQIMTRSAGLILNIQLAQAMNEHSQKYPALYDEVKAYIPSFFRVTEMSADPVGPNTRVTMIGVIQTYQQYADLMLALLRVPNSFAVTRQGYQLNAPLVPPITENNQIAEPLKPGEDPLPEDPLAALDERINRARGRSGMEYDGTGNFGSLDVNTRERGAMPNWSEITVELYIGKDINTPDPRGSLAQAPALWGSTPAPNQTRNTQAPVPNRGPARGGAG